MSTFWYGMTRNLASTRLAIFKPLVPLGPPLHFKIWYGYHIGNNTFLPESFRCSESWRRKESQKSFLDPFFNIQQNNTNLILWALSFMYTTERANRARNIIMWVSFPHQIQSNVWSGFTIFLAIHKIFLGTEKRGKAGLLSKLGQIFFPTKMAFFYFLKKGKKTHSCKVERYDVF